MNFPDWIGEFPGAVTVCDAQGVIVYMNEKSKATFAADGGGALVGNNVLDCHPAAARARLAQLMAAQQTNVYTIEKNGIKKLIYQAPWIQDGQYAGIVELSLEIPFEMPHFVRG
jgi:transcriptional regulator with PAS, ATPase and Fis domain